MFGFFKRRTNPSDQVNEYLKGYALEKFDDPEFKKAVKAELEGFANEKEVSDLEIALLGVHVGGASLTQLAGALEHANVLLLAKSHDKPGESLCLRDPRDQTFRIVIFSSEKRAVKAMRKHPEYRCLLTVPARNLISNMADSLGLAINLYEPIVTCNFTPQQLAVYKKCISKGAPSNSIKVIEKPNLPPIPSKLNNQAADGMVQDDQENTFLQFRSGILQPQQFFPGLLKSEVFILVKYLNGLNAPLFLDNPDGAPRLAIFTSPERAKPLQEKHPEYRYAVSAPCHQILAGVPAGNGLVMNPGSEAVTFQMTPEQFARFKIDFMG